MTASRIVGALATAPILVAGLFMSGVTPVVERPVLERPTVERPAGKRPGRGRLPEQFRSDRRRRLRRVAQDRLCRR